MIRFIKKQQREVYRYISEMEGTIAAIRKIIGSTDTDTVKVQRIRQHIREDVPTTITLQFSEHLYERLAKQAKKEGKRLTQLLEGIIVNYVSSDASTSSTNDHAGEKIVQSFEITLSQPFADAWYAYGKAQAVPEEELLAQICSDYLRKGG